MGCGDMGGIAQAEHHDRFIVDLQASGTDAEEVIANRLGRGAEFAVENGPDCGRRIVGRRFIGGVLVGGGAENALRQVSG